MRQRDLISVWQGIGATHTTPYAEITFVADAGVSHQDADIDTRVNTQPASPIHATSGWNLAIVADSPLRKSSCFREAFFEARL